MFDIPFFAFWVLLILGRKQLGVKGIAIFVAVWVAAYVVFIQLGFQPALYVTAQAIIDIVLVLVVFKGDMQIT